MQQSEIVVYLISNAKGISLHFKTQKGFKAADNVLIHILQR